MAYLRQRAVAVFLTVVLLAALAGGSLYALRAASLARDRRAQAASRDLIDVERLSAAVSRKSAATRGFLLSGDARLLSEVDGARAQFGEAIGRLRSDASTGETSLLDDIQRAESRHQANFEQLAQLRGDPSHLTDVARLFQRETLQLRQALDDAIDRYRAAKERAATGARQAAERGTFGAQALLLMLAIAALGALGVVLVRLYRAVSNVRESEERLRKLVGQIEGVAADWRMTFDAVDSLIVILSREGRIVRLNRAAAAALGHSPAQLVGQSLADHSAREPWRTATRLLAGEPGSGSQRVRDAGTGHTWDIVMSPLEESAIILARDITAIAELEESLHRSETLSAMGSLVAGVAHEVRNPLFGVSATLDAFQARFGAQPGYQPYLEVLRSEVTRLGTLMGELLDYGRPRDLERRPTALRDVLAQAIEACRPLADHAGVTLESAIPADLPMVSLDSARARQVFQNLIENAIQHSPPRSAVELQAVSRDGGVTFCVLDRGPGFREEDLPHIFEPFFSRRQGGTGLGLSITKRLVEQHGWGISAANRQGGGAAFTLQVPLHSGQDRV